MAYCPDCVSFKNECNPDFEDYNEPCPYYKSVHDELAEYEQTCPNCSRSYEVCLCHEDD